MKTIIVTGANGNLGVATVRKLLQTGYRVIAVDHADSQLGFAREHADFSWQRVDLTDEGAAAAFVKQGIEKHGQIDGALMLIGGFAMGDLAATGAAELRSMYTLNFETAYFLTRPLLAHMMEKGYGRLVFIGARPALVPAQGKAALAYALTKGLLFHLADLVNAGAKGKNVVASVVAPSTIDTAANRNSMPTADPAQWVKPGQIADLLEFICSEKGDAIREPVYKVYNNA